MNKRERRNAWVAAGMPEDLKSLEKYEITMKDIRAVEAKVLRAIERKLAQDPNVFIFAEHRTLQ